MNEVNNLLRGLFLSILDANNIVSKDAKSDCNSEGPNDATEGMELVNSIRVDISESCEDNMDNSSADDEWNVYFTLAKSAVGKCPSPANEDQEDSHSELTAHDGNLRKKVAEEESLSIRLVGVEVEKFKEETTILEEQRNKSKKERVVNILSIAATVLAVEFSSLNE